MRKTGANIVVIVAILVFFSACEKGVDRKIKVPDPLIALEALQKAGYVTDPQYEKKLKSIINTYYLHKYDQ